MSGTRTVGLLLLLLWCGACLWLPGPAQGALVIPGPDGGAEVTFGLLTYLSNFAALLSSFSNVF